VQPFDGGGGAAGGGGGEDGSSYGAILERVLGELQRQGQLHRATMQAIEDTDEWKDYDAHVSFELAYIRHRYQAGGEKDGAPHAMTTQRRNQMQAHLRQKQREVMDMHADKAAEAFVQTLTPSELQALRERLLRVDAGGPSLPSSSAAGASARGAVVLEDEELHEVASDDEDEVAELLERGQDARTLRARDARSKLRMLTRPHPDAAEDEDEGVLFDQDRADRVEARRRAQEGARRAQSGYAHPPAEGDDSDLDTLFKDDHDGTVKGSRGASAMAKDGSEPDSDGESDRDEDDDPEFDALLDRLKALEAQRRQQGQGAAQGQGQGQGQGRGGAKMSEDELRTALWEMAQGLAETAPGAKGRKVTDARDAGDSVTFDDDGNSKRSPRGKR
jgi:hypothetical protein